MAINKTSTVAEKYEQPQQTPVYQALSHLNERLGRLSDTISMVYDRVRPVCASRDADENEQFSPLGESDVVQQLSKLTQIVIMLDARLHQLLIELEV